MVGQRLGRWRGEAGHTEVGAAARRGPYRWAATSAKRSPRSRPRRDSSDAGNGRRPRLVASRPRRFGRAFSGRSGCGSSRPFLTRRQPLPLFLSLRSVLPSQGAPLRWAGRTVIAPAGLGEPALSCREGPDRKGGPASWGDLRATLIILSG